MGACFSIRTAQNEFNLAEDEKGAGNKEILGGQPEKSKMKHP